MLVDIAYRSIWVKTHTCQILYVHLHHRSTICAFSLWLQGVKMACVVDVRCGLLVYCAWLCLYIYIYVMLYTLYREPIIATCHFNLKVWHDPKSARMFWYTTFFATKKGKQRLMLNFTGRDGSPGNEDFDVRWLGLIKYHSCILEP